VLSAAPSVGPGGWPLALGTAGMAAVTAGVDLYANHLERRAP
jgi:hypothetical protein